MRRAWPRFLGGFIALALVLVSAGCGSTGDRSSAGVARVGEGSPAPVPALPSAATPVPGAQGSAGPPAPSRPAAPGDPILLTLHVRSETGSPTWVAVVGGIVQVGKPWGLMEPGVSVACIRADPGQRVVVLATEPGAIPAVPRLVLYEALPGDVDPVRWIDIDASGVALGGTGRPGWDDSLPDPCRIGEGLPG